MHKRHSFLKGSLKRFIHKYGISFAYLQVPPEMICRKQDHRGQKFFILTLRRNGGILKIPFSQGGLVKEWPTIEETLESLSFDILLYLDNATPEELAAEFGEDDPEELEEQWEILKSLTERTATFLGQEGFDDLISMALEDFGLGGDRGWLRQRICG